MRRLVSWGIAPKICLGLGMPSPTGMDPSVASNFARNSSVALLLIYIVGIAVFSKVSKNDRGNYDDFAGVVIAVTLDPLRSRAPGHAPPLTNISHAIP